MHWYFWFILTSLYKDTFINHVWWRVRPVGSIISFQWELRFIPERFKPAKRPTKIGYKLTDESLPSYKKWFSSSWTAHFLFLIHPCHLHFLWQRVQVWPWPKGWYRHLSWWKEIHDIQKLKVATWKKDCVVSDWSV